MEGGKIKDFIESFSYQSIAVIFKGQKYFSDGKRSKARDLTIAERKKYNKLFGG